MQKAVYVREGDCVHRLAVTLTSHGEAYSPDGCTVTLYGEADGTVQYVPGFVSDGQALVFLPPSVLVPGNHRFELRVTDADGRLVTSPKLMIVAEDILFDGEAVEAASDFDAVDAFTKSADTAAALAASYAQSAEQSASDAAEAAARVIAMSVNPPRIGENGTWEVWDGDTSSYTDTHVSAVVSGEGGGNYPPSGGVPYADMSAGVKASLDKADTAYQKPNGGIPDTDLIGTVRATLASVGSKYVKPASGIPVSDLASGVIPTVPTALNQLIDDSTHRTVTDAEKSTWNGKQPKTITDSAGYFTTDTVEGALAELGAELAGINTLIGSGVIS